MKHKKAITLMLAAATALNTVAPTFADENANSSAAGAAQSTAYTVQYSQVEQMVRDQNLQVQSNGLTVGNLSDEDETKEKYEELEGTIDAAEKTLTAIVSSPSATQDLKTVAQGTNVALSSLLAMFSAQDDVSGDDYKLTELQMDEANDQLVESAQSLFSVYYQLQYNIQQLTNTRVTLEDAVKAAQAKIAAGLGTAVAVTDAENAVTSLDNSMADLQNQSKEIGYQMNQLLGHPYNDQITFGEMPAPDTDYAGKINLQNDIAAATAASYDVQLAQVRRNLAEDGTDENRDQIDIASNSIELATQKAGASVEKQYDAIQKGQAALALGQKTLDNAKLKWNQAQLQYNTGTISKIDLDTAENGYLEQQSVVAAAQATLFWNIETYKWIVKGLASAS